MRSFAPAAHARRPVLLRSVGWLGCALLFHLAASTSLAGYQAEGRTAVPRSREVVIVCPKLVPTRVVLPERVTGYRGDPAAEATLGFQIQTRPEPVITVRPRAHPIEARFRIEGATRALVLVFRTAQNGEPRDIRLTFGSATAPDTRSAPAALPRAQHALLSPTAIEKPKPPHVGTTPLPTSPLSAAPDGDAAQPAAASSAPNEPSGQAASEAPTTPRAATNAGETGAEPEPPGLPASQTLTASDASAAPGALLDAGILTARVRSVGRVERLPGQRPVELVDILEGRRHVWLRFSIGEARGARVDGVSWEHGRITAYAVEDVDKGSRLALVVQLPRRSETGTSLITKSTRIHIKLNDGERRFPLSAPWLGSVVKDLFGW